MADSLDGEALLRCHESDRIQLPLTTPREPVRLSGGEVALFEGSSEYTGSEFHHSSLLCWKLAPLVSSKV